MGLLAESKTRRTISRDPNNTKWTRDTTTFGQKILRAQGWEPGQFLGAKDAPHSELHTAANASYIRVLLKDDMKGLGFDKAKENEVTGLDVFQDVLSRLNGKSQTEVEIEQQARLVVKTHRYVEQRWGPMRFVRGGLLVGDAMKEEENDLKQDSQTEETAPQVTTSKKERSKKRKAESLEDSNSESSDEDAKEKKKRRKEERKAKKKLAASTPTDTSETEKAETASAKKGKKEKKKKSKKNKAQHGKESETEPSSVSSGEEATELEEVSEVTKSKDGLKESKKSKKEKRDKKDKKEEKEKKDKKDKKKRKKHGSENPDTEMSDAVQPSFTSTLTTGQSTPTGTGASTPVNHRNFVRSRFIAQKTRAFMDPAALKQILMVKAS